jgi:hypothetical protein
MEASPGVIVPDRRLGKLPPKFDPRTLRMSKYAKRKTLRATPKTQNRLSRVMKVRGVWDLYANDELGDCTCAGAAHMDTCHKVWGKQPGGFFTRQQVIEMYSKYCGYVPGQPSTDNGGYLLDVLNGLRKDGIIKAFVALDPQNDEHMRYAIHVFGGVYSGLMLPVSAQSEKIWTKTDGPGSDPWSWGGHCVFTGAYTTKLYRCVTWGAMQSMTYDWRKRYMDEAFAVIDEDWIRANGKSVTGFDMKQLEADLATL